MKRFEHFFHFFIDVLFWSFLLLFVYLILFKIFGHSPTDTQLLYGGFAVILAYLLGFSFHIGIFTGRVKEFMSTSKHSFSQIHTDMYHMQSDIRTMQSDIHHLQSDVRHIHSNMQTMQSDIQDIKETLK